MCMPQAGRKAAARPLLASTIAFLFASHATGVTRLRVGRAALAMHVPLARAGAAARLLRATQEQIAQRVICNRRDAPRAGWARFQTSAEGAERCARRAGIADRHRRIRSARGRTRPMRGRIHSTADRIDSMRGFFVVMTVCIKTSAACHLATNSPNGKAPKRSQK